MATLQVNILNATTKLLNAVIRLKYLCRQINILELLTSLLSYAMAV